MKRVEKNRPNDKYFFRSLCAMSHKCGRVELYRLENNKNREHFSLRCTG